MVIEGVLSVSVVVVQLKVKEECLEWKVESEGR